MAHPPIVRPTAGQLAWQHAAMGVFFHFGVNTFNDREWSDGTLAPTTFDPDDLDADQWVRVAQDAGAAYVILTAKHHDGFCLWPTTTTDYSVRSSPWRDGDGDVVGELAQACRRHGMKLGLYLSPWDRNASCYSDPAAYDAYYLAQLRELCTGYGELFELWFDGAGSEGREYDWTAIADLIDELQPGAMIFNMGRPTIRWVGNEDGLAADPVEYAVTRTQMSMFTVKTAELTEALYLPPECDVSIRPGWFYQPAEEPKSVEHLLAIHYASIGLGANLLLNLPPDRHGRIPDADATRVQEWRAELNRRFATPLLATLRVADGAEIVIDFGDEVSIDHLDLAEHLDDGQQITDHTVTGPDGEIVRAGTIGVRRRHAFDPVTVRTLRVTLTGADGALGTEALTRSRRLCHRSRHRPGPARPVPGRVGRRRRRPAVRSPIDMRMSIGGC